MLKTFNDRKLPIAQTDEKNAHLIISKLDSCNSQLKL